MAEVKDKVVTVESLGAVYNELNDNKLSLSGGTLSGALEFNEGYGRILANATQTQIETRNVAGNTDNRRVINIRNSDAGVGLQYALSLLDIADGKTTTHHIYGTHNKPSGNYSGNGSATSRTIEIGGVGGILAVFSGSYMIGFITQNGAVFFNTTNSTVKCFSVSVAKYSNGVLTIASNDTFLNGDGNTYHYQVL